MLLLLVLGIVDSMVKVVVSFLFPVDQLICICDYEPRSREIGESKVRYSHHIAPLDFVI